MSLDLFQTKELRQEDARDQLRVMIQLQDKYYRCEDYLHLDSMEPEPHSPLHVVVQCALVVTDIPQPPTLSRTTQPSSSPSVLSPVRVSTFPHPTADIFDPVYIKGYGEEHTSSGRSRMAMSEVRSPLPPVQAARLAGWRQRMIEWAYNVADTYSLDREVVAVAFHLLDRFIASEVFSSEEDYAQDPIDREDFQLYSMVCLYIAIKALVPVRKLTMECIIEMSRGFYNKQHITEAELDVLDALNWHVNPATVMDFCRLYLHLFPNSLDEEMLHASCQNLAELALDDIYFINKPTSLVALSAVLLAAQRFGVSFDETQGFLANLQGLITVETLEFDGLFRRLESLF